MKSKFYSLARLRLRVDSESKIADSRLYADFYAPEGDCDVRVRVTEGPLPEKKGRLMSRNEWREYYDDNGELILYSLYPRMAGPYTFACREGTGAEIGLTVDNPEGMWDAMLFHALNIPELTARRGFFQLHCSYIIFRGEAVLFSADKGVGKSTQAALWEKHRGAEIVNGDRALLHLTENGLTAYGTPYCGSSDIALNRAAPVKAVVLLSQGDRNLLELCRGTEPFLRILGQLTFEPYQNQDAVDFTLGVCSRVPVYSLQCLPEESAVSLLETTLWKA